MWDEDRSRIALSPASDHSRMLLVLARSGGTETETETDRRVLGSLWAGLEEFGWRTGDAKKCGEDS